MARVKVHLYICALLATGAYGNTGAASAIPGLSPELSPETLFLSTPALSTNPLATATPASTQPCLACMLQSYMSGEMVHGRLQHASFVFNQDIEDTFMSIVRDEAAQGSVDYEDALSGVANAFQEGIERRRNDRQGAKRARELLNTLFGSGTDRGILGKTFDNMRELVKAVMAGLADSQSRAAAESAKSAAPAPTPPPPKEDQDPPPGPKKSKKPPPPKSDDDDDGDMGDDDGDQDGENARKQKKASSPRPATAPNHASGNKGGGNAGSKNPPNNQWSQGNPSPNKGNPGSGNGPKGSQNSNGSRGNKDDEFDDFDDDFDDDSDKGGRRGSEEWHNA